MKTRLALGGVDRQIPQCRVSPDLHSPGRRIQSSRVCGPPAGQAFQSDQRGRPMTFRMLSAIR